ncbi:sigma factor [Baaleninema sp.]|uniref:sigma factor n=1 Tax=Baaleninema sp. TaxID=3101197 RepID=UPI003D050A7F
MGERSLHQQLQQLIEATCQHPPGSLPYQQGMTKILRLVLKSGKLWRDNHPVYEDVLQETCLYLCQNLCSKYDPQRSQLLTWLNFYLKQRLKDAYRDRQKQQQREVSTFCKKDGETAEIWDFLAAKPDVPPILSELYRWVETDASGELRQLHLKHRPDITVQVLLLRRLPPETSWKDLSAEFNVPISSLSSFYERHCRPRLRKFGVSEGYL